MCSLTAIDFGLDTGIYNIKESMQVHVLITIDHSFN